MICDRCLDSSIPGYGFCIDCKQTNPEILCLPCSKRHCAKDEFTNHEICTNFDLMKQGERYILSSFHLMFKLKKLYALLHTLKLFMQDLWCDLLCLINSFYRSENDSVQTYQDENTDVDICSNSQVFILLDVIIN